VKRDRQRDRRDRAKKHARVAVAFKKLPPKQRCPDCGSSMGRWDGAELQPGQKVQCHNGHVYIRREDPRGPDLTDDPEVPTPAQLHAQAEHVKAQIAALTSTVGAPS
jgi:hypothetical protein